MIRARHLIGMVYSFTSANIVRREEGQLAKRVFLSFVEEDLTLVNLFRGQAKNKNSDLEFADYSVKEPYDSTNAVYIRAKIRERIGAASVTICLVGEATYTSKWVDWEIDASREEGNRVFGVRLHSNATKDIPPKALINLKAPMYNWDIDAIVNAIG
jgi:DNA-directed RNA polymerase subunit L